MTSADRTAEEVAFAALAEDHLLTPDVTEGTGFGPNPGLRIHGKIFAMLMRGELVVKLPADRCAALAAAGAGHPLEMKGRSMREWVVLDGLPIADWPAVVDEALAFVRP